MEKEDLLLRSKIIDKVKRVVIKVGTGVLTANNGDVDFNIFQQLSNEIFNLKKKGYQLVLVTSGAIAFGKKKLGFSKTIHSIPHKQAAAAVGQTSLMWNYEKCFSIYGQKVAQVLLTHKDLSNRQRYLNAKHTLETLTGLNVLPIINENDSVVVDEIMFGDNDNLASLITTLFESDILIILTDTDGFYEKDPNKDSRAKFFSIISSIDENIEKLAKNTMSPDSTGGMATKIMAAKKAAAFGVPTIIANGKKENILSLIFSGKNVGTLCISQKDRMNSRKHWIAYTLKLKGKVKVDAGARDAILTGGKSLLPSGICEVEGSFEAGDCISIITPS
ncbi:MAG: glutamate 5-kinase, partial [Thermodesulfobacteriota bacterium]|nr:glutamate 5-kinase [Thermodesulfobacteriota bacterium]